MSTTRKIFVLACLILFAVTVVPLSTVQVTTAAGTKVEDVQNVKININSADVEQLSSLPGIGEKTADSIVSYRNENGKFKQIEDLMNIKGIGEKKFGKLKNKITL